MTDDLNVFVNLIALSFESYRKLYVNIGYNGLVKV